MVPLLLLYHRCCCCCCCCYLLSPITGPFSPVLLLNQLRSPPLSLQVSDCSTFCMMCNVPSTAVFCAESVQWFPGTASKCFCKTFVTVPVAPVITGMIIHLFYLCTYCSLFSAAFCVTFLSAGIATSISMHAFPFFFLIRRRRRRGGGAGGGGGGGIEKGRRETMSKRTILK